MFDLNSRILVVDDASAMRMVVTGFLKEIGFSNLTEASNGQQAYDLIANGGKFDIIFSDHHMPELTGLELLRKVRELDSWKNTTFFMLTSESEKGMIVDALKRGASNYIIKPVNLETLKSKMQAAFERIQKSKT